MTTTGASQTNRSLHDSIGSSACERVFATLELAEAIFIHLEMETLLSSTQRVCRWWQNVVQTSSVLQEHLFYRPVVPQQLRWQAHPRRKNSLVDPNRGHWADRLTPGTPRAMIENPLLYILCGPLAATNPLFSRPEASWRKQLLTQPAVEEITLHSYEAWIDLKASDTSKGVTLGDVAQHGQLINIRGWCKWKPFDDHEQMQRVKTEARLEGQDLHAHTAGSGILVHSAENSSDSERSASHVSAEDSSTHEDSHSDRSSVRSVSTG